MKQPVFTSTLLPAIPRPIRWTLRRIYFLPADLLDRLLGQRDELVPPRGKNFTGVPIGFKSSGETSVRQLVDLAALTPDSKVLDVGCGLGRVAVPLTRYLTAHGSYDGLDIVRSGIDWCNENIASKYPNFHFTVADVFNKEYNPSGRVEASDYRFPYSDEAFDVAVLVSVFTHMLPTDMERYVEEISRVLVRGGRCFATYFLINSESRRLMDSGAGSLRFKHNLGSHWIVSDSVPELSVGYDEAYVRELYTNCGLIVEDGIYYGGWCGRGPRSQESGLTDQDLVVATKR